jgi:hypothetical protein
MPATPLGFERLKICELFAELLHCSNMSNLNFTEEQEQKEETDGDRLKLKFVQEKVLPTCIVSIAMYIMNLVLSIYLLLY